MIGAAAANCELAGLAGLAGQFRARLSQQRIRLRDANLKVLQNESDTQRQDVQEKIVAQYRQHEGTGILKP